MKPNHIPVFYHIPKNAGTYIQNRVFAACAIRSILHITGLERPPVKICDVVVDDHVLYRVIIYIDPKNERHFEHFKTICDHSIQIEYDDFLSVLEKATIQSIAVQDSGFRRFSDDWHEVLKDQTVYKYTCLRDPYSRCQSMFNYLKSPKSHHEPHHDVFKDMLFIEYLNSFYLEDSWLIKNTNQMNDQDIITSDHYYCTCKMLSTMNICNMKNVDKCLSIMFDCCYNFDLSEHTYRGIYKNIHYNKTDYIDTIEYNKLSQYTKNVFKKRVKFDLQIYTRFNMMIEFNSTPRITTIKK